MGLYNRQSAVAYLISCLRIDPLSGYQVVVDQRNFLNPNQSKVFLWNQCALTCEVFRRLGIYSTEKTSIINAMHYHLDAKYNPTNNSFNTLVDSSIFPSVFSDKTNSDLYFQHNPYLITSNHATSTTPTVDITTMTINRLLLRCIHSYNTNDTTDALACWNEAMLDYDGWSIGYDAPKSRYDSYLVFLQHYAQKLTGYTSSGGTVTRVRPDHADYMQETDRTKGEGKIKQFYTGNSTNGYLTIGAAGNTEATAVCVLSDILINGV